MLIKTYDTILTELCNALDSALSPVNILRANSNIIYLVLKSFSKGCEAIHNSVVSLRNKFDPVNCDVEDLDSIAKLVGTTRHLGSASGLEVTVKNNGKEFIILEPGIYTFKQSEDAVFTYVNTLNDDLAAGTSKKQIFMSKEIKPIYVTAQESILVKAVHKDGSKIELSSDLVFSCKDNKGLQGSFPESDLAFRQRIVTGNSTATLLNKMETEINNLPYIYSCRLVFNNSTSVGQIGDVSIDPYNLLLIISGAPDEKVAEIVASYGVYETMQVAPGKYIDYKNDIFLKRPGDDAGYYRVYYMEPKELKYGINITYEADPTVISTIVVQKKITDALEKYKNTNDYVPLLTEREFSNYLMNLGINTLQILDIDLFIDEGSPVDYIKVDKTKVARLNQIKFSTVA